MLGHEIIDQLFQVVFLNCPADGKWINNHTIALAFYAYYCISEIGSVRLNFCNYRPSATDGHDKPRKTEIRYIGIV